jgi:hypothetical protein
MSKEVSAFSGKWEVSVKNGSSEPGQLPAKTGVGFERGKATLKRGAA